MIKVDGVPVSNIQPNFIHSLETVQAASVRLSVCPSGMFPRHKSICNTNRNEQKWTPDYITLFCILYLEKLAVTNSLSNNLVLLLKIPSGVLFLDKKCYTILY